MTKKRRPPAKKRWQDHYTRRAKKANYPARSVFKLLEIQQKFRLIRKGDRVLDLGCAPGAWLLFAAEKAGAGGKIVGVDLQKVDIELPPQVMVIQADAADAVDGRPAGIQGEFDVVLSDMAPATTGSKVVDASRSHELCRAALAVALQVLKPGGFFVCKIFQGAELKQFETEVRGVFEKTRIFKPQSSRKSSKEIFILGLRKRGSETGGAIDVRTQ